MLKKMPKKMIPNVRAHRRKVTLCTGINSTYEEKVITWNTGDIMEQSRLSSCYECYPSKNPKNIQLPCANRLFYVFILKVNK